VIVSLRARLLAGLLALTAAGMLIAGAVTYAEQRSFSYQRVDEQTRDAPFLLARELDAGDGDGGRAGGPDGPGGGDSGPLGPPAGTYGELRTPAGTRSVTLPVGSGITAKPDLPVDPPLDKLFTVSGDGGRYRALAQRDPRTGGTLIAAVPLREADQQLERLLVVEALVIAAVLLVLGIASWAVVRVTGQPVVGEEQVVEAGRLPVGAWLQTDPASRASVAIADIGRLDVDPGTRLQLLGTREGNHRVALQRGTVHALIWAPPGEFVVETEASTAIDLGCAYTLTVAPGGNGMIEVSMGWVGFEHGGREAFIPAGARCATRPGVGPGTPYYADIGEPMRQAIDQLDFAAMDPAERRRALGAVLADARPKDAMTLWHLLARVPAEDRDPVFDHLARLAPPPASVTREGIRAGNRAMRDAWWDTLGLGTSRWWRIWERSWR